MHKRDLRKLITNFEPAAEYAARFFSRAWPDGAPQVREHILDCCRRMLNDEKIKSLMSGGLYINHVDEFEFEVFVDPTPWMKAEDKANGRK